MSLIDRFACFLVPLLFATTSSALTIRPPSFDELVRTADVIIDGEVVQIESVLRTVEGRSVPFTLVTLHVSETLKGQSRANLVLQCLGGTVGNQSLRVVGVPEFVIGDRGFFFVQNNGTQFFPLVGVTHGLYRTVRDEQTGTEIVARENGEPLRSPADVALPLGHLRHRDKTAYGATPEAALSPAMFSSAIKAEVSSHASR